MRMLTILAIAVAAFQASPLSAAELEPHEAEYRIIMTESRWPGEIRSWDAAGWIRISRDCRKWKMETEFVFQIGLDGNDFEARLYSVQYEALDGTRMEFDYWLENNGEVTEQLKGTARLGGQGNPGTVKYRIPRGRTETLPAGTMFPIAAIVAGIDKFAAGKNMMDQLVFFNGELKSYSMSILKRGAAAPARPAGDTSLTSRTGWLIESAKYDPVSEVTKLSKSLVHENGVTSMSTQIDAMWDTRQELVRIKRLPTPQC